MESLRYTVDGTPCCPFCAEHLREESWRLMDSFRDVLLASGGGSIKELRHAYFGAYHERGHVKTEDGAELDGELLDLY